MKLYFSGSRYVVKHIQKRMFGGQVHRLKFTFSARVTVRKCTYFYRMEIYVSKTKEKTQTKGMKNYRLSLNFAVHLKTLFLHFLKFFRQKSVENMCSFCTQCISKNRFFSFFSEKIA